MSSRRSLSELRLLAARRRDAALGIDQQIARGVKHLQAGGYTMSELAEAVGLSRQGLYDLLRRHER